jgi:hypothetical protein
MTSYRAQSTDEYGGVEERVVKLRGCYKYRMASRLALGQTEYCTGNRDDKPVLCNVSGTIDQNILV